jgi:hypothetical protein
LKVALGAFLLLLASPMVHAQSMPGDAFADGKDGAKVHKASGFVCPAKIGLFERDAVGDADPETQTDFCAYSVLNGVYGTIKLTPLTGAYDPKASLASDFTEQEGTGGKEISEKPEILAGAAEPLSVYARSYETSKLEDLHYRVLFTGADAEKPGPWKTTIEYADPRDTPPRAGFPARDLCRRAKPDRREIALRRSSRRLHPLHRRRPHLQPTSLDTLVLAYPDTLQARRRQRS